MTNEQFEKLKRAYEMECSRRTEIGALEYDLDTLGRMIEYVESASVVDTTKLSISMSTTMAGGEVCLERMDVENKDCCKDILLACKQSLLEKKKLLENFEVIYE